MTKAEMQTIIKGKLTEKLIDTTTIDDDLDMLFAQWFQALVQGAIQAAEMKAQKAMQQAQGAEGGGEEGGE